VGWLVGWGVIGTTTDLPAFPVIHYNMELAEDYGEILNNTSLWDGLGTKGKVFYVIIPVGEFVFFLGWVSFGLGPRRKKLWVNGVKYGTVMWIYGYRRGHVYDLSCLVFNRGRHWERWADVPRPISGSFMEGRTVIYYRPGWVHPPWLYFRLIPEELMIYLFNVQVIVPVEDGKPINVYSHRVTDPLRPYIVYTDLSHTTDLKHSDGDLEKIQERHKVNQERILETTWRMTRAEPGTASYITRKSSYSIPDRTVGQFLRKLPDNDRDRVRELWENGK